MIQRIQSLYLLLAAIALILFGLFGIPAPSQFGIYPWLAYALLGLASVGALLSLGAIFLYSNREKQRQVVRLDQWLIVVLTAMLVAAFVLLPGLRGTLEQPAAAIGYLMVLVAYICVRLAQRSIGKDIALVRSMDRLR